MSKDGTAQYEDAGELPSLVREALLLAERMEFSNSCRPEQGRLLAVLAAGRTGGVIGETGTGCGVGLAWLVSGSGPGTRIVSVERDIRQAAAVASLFRHLPNVEILNGDWTDIAAYAPFDLLFLDGGGEGRRTSGDRPLDPVDLLAPRGSIVLDDFSFNHQAEDRTDNVRSYYLSHPDLAAAEILIASGASSVVGTRR
ncbi:class I SAM-dependent methyltransferase [Kribbella sp. NBC_00482]|uniref:O-methyltransferase n=1 Tax=Kribbella sp. NBC_00482 TaxID=2975968 RepID=UPI002E192A43